MSRADDVSELSSDICIMALGDSTMFDNVINDFVGQSSRRVASTLTSRVGTKGETEPRDSGEYP